MRQVKTKTKPVRGKTRGRTSKVEANGSTRERSQARASSVRERDKMIGHAGDDRIPEEVGPMHRMQGYYGSGGSYGYGGGFEHPDYPEDEQASRAAPSPDREHGWFRGQGPMEPFDAYGSFGSTLGDHGRSPQRAWSPRGRAAKGPFFGRAPRDYKRSDVRIREDVCDQLMVGHVNPSAVSVSVKDGEVTLDGFVDNRRDKYVVEEMASHVLGVADVHNRLRVGSRR